MISFTDTFASGKVKNACGVTITSAAVLYFLKGSGYSCKN